MGKLFPHNCDFEEELVNLLVTVVDIKQGLGGGIQLKMMTMALYDNNNHHYHYCAEKLDGC